MNLVRLGTKTGIVSFRIENSRPAGVRRMLQGEDLVCLAHDPRRPDILLAGSYGNGLFRSTDGGIKWDRVPLQVEYVRVIEFDPRHSGRVYLGSEPANLHASDDSGKTWADLEIRQLPESSGWSLPYSPRGGALRSIALPRREHGTIYGAVEQGGVLKSTDQGKSWTITQSGVHPDVHWLALDPSSANRVFAATGGGLFRTDDGGSTWKKLHPGYVRAVLVDPDNPDRVLAGPARDVDEGGTVLLSSNRGEHWEEAGEGLIPPLPDMIESFHLHRGFPRQVFAVTSGGNLFWSSLDTFKWRALGPDIKKVQFVD